MEDVISWLVEKTSFMNIKVKSVVEHQKLILII